MIKIIVEWPNSRLCSVRGESQSEREPQKLPAESEVIKGLAEKECDKRLKC